MERNRGLNLAKKNELWSLIKKLAEYWQEQDESFIKEYAKEVYETNNLDSAIKCFKDLNDQAKWIRNV